MLDLIGSSNVKLTQLVTDYGYAGKDSKEFLEEFQAVLGTLKQQIVNFVHPINPHTTAELSSFSTL